MACGIRTATTRPKGPAWLSPQWAPLIWLLVIALLMLWHWQPAFHPVSTRAVAGEAKVPFFLLSGSAFARQSQNQNQHVGRNV